MPPEVTVATRVLEETQGEVAEGLPDPVRTAELLTQALRVPLILGKAVTVKEVVTAHPFEFVYVIFVDPAATAVTNPALLIVATFVLEEIQGFVAAADPDPVS